MKTLLQGLNCKREEGSSWETETEEDFHKEKLWKWSISLCRHPLAPQGKHNTPYWDVVHEEITSLF